MDKDVVSEDIRMCSKCGTKAKDENLCDWIVFGVTHCFCHLCDEILNYQNIPDPVGEFLKVGEGKCKINNVARHILRARLRRLRGESIWKGEVNSPSP